MATYFFVMRLLMVSSGIAVSLRVILPLSRLQYRLMIVGLAALGLPLRGADHLINSIGIPLYSIVAVSSTVFLLVQVKDADVQKRGLMLLISGLAAVSMSYLMSTVDLESMGR